MSHFPDFPDGHVAPLCKQTPDLTGIWANVILIHNTPFLICDLKLVIISKTEMFYFTALLVNYTIIHQLFLLRKQNDFVLYL